MKPLPFKKKISHIVNNGEGKLFCYVIEKNYQLPHILIYNLNKNYPYYDRFAYHREKFIRETAKHRGKVRNFSKYQEQIVRTEDFYRTSPKKANEKKKKEQGPGEIEM